MAERIFPDEWLVPTITSMLGAEVLDALRAKAQPTSTLWDLVTADRHTTDDELLATLAKRCRVKLADLTKRDSKIKEIIPEARLLIVPHAGHMTPLETPAVFNAAVLAFLREAEALDH